MSRVYRIAISSTYLTGKTRKKIPTDYRRRSNLMIQKYGSPFILKEFNPHFTLLSSPPADPEARQEILNKLQTTFQEIVPPEAVEIDEICLLAKQKHDKRWEIIEKFSLSGR